MKARARSLHQLANGEMFFLAFLIAVTIVLGLTVLGAAIASRNPGTDWESHEDRPILGPHDHFH